MPDNKSRIAKNMLFLYSRNLFVLVISLYTSRIVLSILGEEDYGIHIVVGGIATMFSVLFSSFFNTSVRFLTFELGKSDQDRMNRIFSTTLIIHAILAATVFLLAETIGLWFLNTKMNIPAERMYAANWVLQCSVLLLLLGIMGNPYKSAILSHERMNILAYIGISEAVLKLVVVLILVFSPAGMDNLIIYSLLYVGIGLSTLIFFIVYSRKQFTECRYGFNSDKELFRNMIGFAGWNFVGTTAMSLKDQGVNILLNLFYGPVVNAARGIAYSVNTAVSGFVSSFMVALNPQITKSYASGEHDYMRRLVQQGTRFSCYILLVFALPLLIETDFVLTLWLKNYPEHTADFVRLILLLTICDTLSHTLITVQFATGKIRDYQIFTGVMLLMNFPISYMLLKVGYAPETTMFVAILISLCCLLIRLILLRKMRLISIRNYLIRVLGNILLVAICSMILPFIVYYCLSEGVMRFMLICITGVIGTAAIAFGMGCTQSERVFIYRNFLQYLGFLKIKRIFRG